MCAKSIFPFLFLMLISYTGLSQPTNPAKDTTAMITCGNMLFAVPAGWKLEADGENYGLFLPLRDNNPQRWINIAIFQGNTSTGNTETDFNNAWQMYLGKYSKHQEPYLEKEKSGKGYDIIRGGTTIWKGNEMPFYAYLWVAKVKERVETIIVFANYSDDFEIALNTEIRPFWAKVHFKNLPGAAPASYTLKGDGVQGLYTGLQSGMRMSGGIAKDISFLLVYNDGKVKVSSKLPENGFTGFDREVDRELNPGYWGEYDLKKRIVVFDKSSQPRTLGFTYRPPKVIYNEYAYTKLASVDALTLLGTYTADQTPTAVSAFGHEPTISFYKDGRFEDNTALYYVKSYDPMFKRTGKGKYTISNFTITLVYDDGRGTASFPFISWDAATNSSVQIGEKVLLKK
jgi:hypothetical protein